VCGSDGKVYDNSCVAEARGVTVLRNVDLGTTDADCARTASHVSGPALKPAPQRPAQQPGSRPSTPAPGDMSERQTSAWDAPANSGAAPANVCACPFILAPVCGVDAKAYDNACLARCAGVEVSFARPDANGNC
jgi:hypothetical protein